jgi:type VI secretion system VasD/TssJ family lipoprotein
MKTASFLMILFCTLLLQSCTLVNSALGGNSTKEARAEISWPFEKDAILVDLVMDHDLNLFNDQAHTLVLGLYQTAEETSFQKILTSAELISNTLTLGANSEGILQLDRYALNPGKRIILKVNRVQGTKYVGVIAGYYNQETATSTRIFRIPLNMESEGWITKSYTAIPSVLAFRLFLGKSGIVNSQPLTYDADKKAVVELLPIKNPPQKMLITPGELKQTLEFNAAATKL